MTSLKKYKYTGACILVMWYAIFDSYSNYSVLVNPSRHIHLILKMKSGQKVRVDQNIIYAGRTANYWFLYNRKTKFIRTIKNDDVDLVDFDTITNSKN
jgi:hypothetical protein